MAASKHLILNGNITSMTPVPKQLLPVTIILPCFVSVLNLSVPETSYFVNVNIVPQTPQWEVSNLMTNILSCFLIYFYYLGFRISDQ